MPVACLKSVAMIDKNHVPVSGCVPTRINNLAAVSSNIQGCAWVGYINSGVIPGEILCNNSLCRPDKLSRGGYRTRIWCHLPRSWRCGNTVWHYTVRNYNNLPNSKLESLVIGKSIKRKIDYRLGIGIILFGN